MTSACYVQNIAHSSLKTSEYGLGVKAIPNVPSFIFGNCPAFGSGKNSNCCTIPTKNKKTSIRANCSPKQRRGPTENGMT